MLININDYILQMKANQFMKRYYQYYHFQKSVSFSFELNIHFSCLFIYLFQYQHIFQNHILPKSNKS